MASERVELIRALAVLVEEPSREQETMAGVLGLRPSPDRIEYTNIFVLQIYPFASVHLGEEGMMGGEARDRVAGFWKAVGRTPPVESDHAASLLGLYAGLRADQMEESDPARALLLEQAADALLWEHLLSWMPAFLAKVREIGGDFYRTWAELLMEVLADEAASIGRQAALPLQLRSTTEVEEGSSIDECVSAILAPVRSGMILTRKDLERGARSSKVGLRVGERRFILKTMLEQDSGSTIGWLRSEAVRWERIHACLAEQFPVISGFWRGRAASTIRLLDELSDVLKHKAS
ncbi:MAG: hypothetical protein GEU71_00685 [Actinobacteria bacterium]|nr:hypothetical protein [Actinomycetota bacterium]